MKALDDIKKIISLVGGQLKSTFQMLSYLKKMEQQKAKERHPDNNNLDSTEDTPPLRGKKAKDTPPKLEIPEKELGKKKKPPLPPLNILNDEPPKKGTSSNAKRGKLANPYIATILMILLLAICVLGFWVLLDVVFPTPTSRPTPPSLSSDPQKKQPIVLKEESSPQKDKDTPKTEDAPSAPQPPEETSIAESTKEVASEKSSEEASEEKSPTLTNTIKEETSPDEHIPYQPPLDLEKTKGFLRTINPHFFAQSPPLNAQGEPYNMPPSVGIVVYNVGINELETDLLLSDLPDTVTFSLSPYASRIDTLIEGAKYLGHTVLIQMPWEDELIYADQGYLTVCTGLTQEKMMEILNKYKRLSKTADGFFAQGGQKLVLHPEELSSTLKFIAATKNCLVAPPDVLMTSLHESAAKEHVNYVSTSIIAPELKDISAIESLAKRTGFAIIAFPTGPNIAHIIEEWIDRLNDLDIEVVPLSKIIREKK